MKSAQKLSQELEAVNRKLREREQEWKAAEEKLLASEEKYRVLAENARHLIITHDLEGAITYANAFALDFMNISPEQIRGKNITQFIPSKEEMDAMKQRQADFLSGKDTVHHYEMKLCLPSGEDRILEVFGNPIKEKGHIKSVLLAAYDITERVRATEMLKNEKKRFSMLLETFPGFIYLQSPDHTIKYANKYFMDLFGDPQGMLCYEVLHKQKDPCSPCPTFEVFQTRKPLTWEWEGAPDGKTYMIYDHPFMDSDGSELVLEIGMDVSDLKHIENKYRESEEKYRSIFENSALGIFRSTPEGRYEEVNEAFANILGFESPEKLIKSVIQISDLYKNPKDRERIQEEFAKKGYVENYEIEAHHPQKGNVWMSVNGKQQRHSNGQIYYEGTIQDITQRKRYEAMLVEAKEKAEESDRLKSAFLSNMSHEIRTPMNGILGFADLLNKSDLSGEEQAKYIGIIQKSGERMLNIINDIIDISKIESGIMEVNRKEVNINKQLQYLLTFFKPEAEKRGLELSLKSHLTPEDRNLITDGEKVLAVLINLVKNALKYTDTGFVEFGCRRKEIRASSFLQFYVKDTGVGIEKERQAVIFERFIQADIEDVRARQGAGLGLSISRAYVEMLGGELWLESEKGKGSVFYFTVPA